MENVMYAYAIFPVYADTYATFRVYADIYVRRICGVHVLRLRTTSFSLPHPLPPRSHNPARILLLLYSCLVAKFYRQ